MLLFSCSQILGGYIDDTVGIDVESNLDLRNTTACGRNSVQTELAEGLVVTCKLTLALYNIDIHCGLVVRCCGEDLALLGRDGGISLDQPGSYAAHCLDGQGKRGDIKKKDVACACIAGKLAALDGSAKGYTLIGVQVLARLFAGQLTNFVLYGRYTGGTADQKDLSQLACGDACIGKRTAYRLCCLLYQIMCQLIKFSSGEVHIKVLRSILCSGDERKVDVGRCCGRKLFFRLLCRFFQSLESHLVVGKIHALGSLELCKHVVCDLLVKVIAAQTVVAGCSQNFDDTVADLDDGNIECTAAEVINHDLLLFFVVKAVCKSCCCRLVDDTFYIKACDLAGVLGSLTLCVIEICRYGDDRFGDLLTQIILCVFFQLLKNKCRDLLRCVLFSVNVYTIVGTHLSLDGRNGLLGVCYCLTFCRLTDETLACLCEGDYGRCCSCTFLVCDNCGLSALHNCYAAVCCS